MSREIYNGTIVYMGKRPTLSFRVSAEHQAEIDGAALRERRKRSEFAVALWSWAWEQYERAGSLEALFRPPAIEETLVREFSPLGESVYERIVGGPPVQRQHTGTEGRRAAKKK